MGDLLHFPAPPAPGANHTDVIRGCWACGLILFDDEPDGLCTDCDRALNAPPVPAAGDEKPLWTYLKHLRPETLRSMADAITETGVTTAEEAAAEWAIAHQLDERARATYVGTVRGVALVEYSQRCHDDAQQLGAYFGWWKP